MNFEDAEQAVRAFRDERDWARFNNPKDLAISISLEVAELLEVFQWSGSDVEVPEKRSHAAEELADVLIYCILMADRLGLSSTEIVLDKLRKNAEKYLVEKARGVSSKDTEL